MKGNTKRVKAAEPAPVDSIDLVDRIEFEDRFCDLEDFALSLGKDVEEIKKKIKKLSIYCGVAAAIIGAFILMRRES